MRIELLNTNLDVVAVADIPDLRPRPLIIIHEGRFYQFRTLSPDLCRYIETSDIYTLLPDQIVRYSSGNRPNLSIVEDL